MSALPLVLSILVLGGPFTAGSVAQTRAEADSADPLRRCSVARHSAEPADRYAVRCAQHFVIEQGYTELLATSDTTIVVPEGIEWRPTRAEWLLQRRGSLALHAAGICVDPHDGRFTVVFRYAHGRGARGVTLDAAFGSLRVQHADFRLQVLEARQHGCRSLDSPGRP